MIFHISIDNIHTIGFAIVLLLLKPRKHLYYDNILKINEVAYIDGILDQLMYKVQ